MIALGPLAFAAPWALAWVPALSMLTIAVILLLLRRLFRKPGQSVLFEAFWAWMRITALALVAIGVVLINRR